jgi:Flp pilus assembly protein TadB
METTPRIVLGSSFGPKRRNNGGMGRFLAWFLGFLATGVALAIGILLAVFAAAAVAMIAVVASVFVFFTGMALRARQQRAYAQSPVLEARKVGHAWVAYGWDRNRR